VNNTLLFVFQRRGREQFKFQVHLTAAAPLKNKKDWVGKNRAGL
jgi:hypothetical protein